MSPVLWEVSKGYSLEVFSYPNFKTKCSCDLKTLYCQNLSSFQRVDEKEGTNQRKNQSNF